LDIHSKQSAATSTVQLASTQLLSITEFILMSQ